MSPVPKGLDLPEQMPGRTPDVQRARGQVTPSHPQGRAYKPGINTTIATERNIKSNAMRRTPESEKSRNTFSTPGSCL